MKMKKQVTTQDCTASTSVSLVVLIRHWPLSIPYQQQLLAMANIVEVHELILVGKHIRELPIVLSNEPKLRSFQLHTSAYFLMAEVGAFEATADVLVILKQGVNLSAQMLQKIPFIVTKGYAFGGLISLRYRWWTSFLKQATIYCKGLFWFRLSQGYFVSRKVYYQSGGFKNNGKLLSFFELLCKQEKLSNYTFLFSQENT